MEPFNLEKAKRGYAFHTVEGVRATLVEELDETIVVDVSIIRYHYLKDGTMPGNRYKLTLVMQKDGIIYKESDFVREYKAKYHRRQDWTNEELTNLVKSYNKQFE